MHAWASHCICSYRDGYFVRQCYPAQFYHRQTLTGFFYFYFYFFEKNRASGVDRDAPRSPRAYLHSQVLQTILPNERPKHMRLANLLCTPCMAPAVLKLLTKADS